VHHLTVHSTDPVNFIIKFLIPHYSIVRVVLCTWTRSSELGRHNSKYRDPVDSIRCTIELDE
jgi:hypothetical protein